MATTPRPGWSKPSTILFASEFPVNEKVFGPAIAQAAESGADLLIFHACDNLKKAPPQASGNRSYDIAAVRAAKQCIEPLAQHARSLRVHCRTVVRPGAPADEILTFLRARVIDRAGPR